MLLHPGGVFCAWEVNPLPRRCAPFLYRFRLAVGRPRLGGRFRPGGGLAAGAEATDLRISAAGLDLYRGAEAGEAVMLDISSGKDLLFTLPVDDVSCCNFRGRYRRRFHSDQSLAFPA